MPSSHRSWLILAHAYVRVARLSDSLARIVLGTYSGDADNEEPLRAVLAHHRCALITDTVLTKSGRGCNLITGLELPQQLAEAVHRIQPAVR